MLASKSTGWLSTGALGVNVNAGFRPSGGTTMPGGTRRIAAVRGVLLLKSDPTGVMTMSTRVPLSTATAGAAGAV